MNYKRIVSELNLEEKIAANLLSKFEEYSRREGLKVFQQGSQLSGYLEALYDLEVIDTRAYMQLMDCSRHLFVDALWSNK